MEAIKKYFPHAFKAQDVKSLIIALVVYVIIDVVCGAVIGLLAMIPVLGIIFGILGSLVGLYALIGIILSILAFLKIVK